MHVYFRINTNSKHFGVRYDAFKGSVYTGHRRTLTKVSNDILIGLTDQRKFG